MTKKRPKTAARTRGYLLNLPTETLRALEAMAKRDRTTVASLLRSGADLLLDDGVAGLQHEVADYAASFALYDRASRALADAYKAAHPEFPADAWPDATTVNVWAAERIAAVAQPIVLSPRDQEHFVSALVEDDGEPDPRLKAAAARAARKPATRASQSPASVAAALDVAKYFCRRCQHPRSAHWERGCTVGCACSERRFL